MKILIYDWALHTIGGGQKFNCKIAEHLSKNHDVDILTLFPVDKKKLEGYYSVDFSKIKRIRHLYNKESLNPSLLMMLSFRKVSKIAFEYDLFFNADAQETVRPSAKHNIMYCHFFGMKWPNPPSSVKNFGKLVLNYSIKTIFPNYSRSYDKVYCNSDYTKGWLKKIWNVNSEVIYPPIDIPKKALKNKKNIVLSLGRLTSDKNYELVIDSFKKVYSSSKKARDFECWICGSGPSQQYYNKLKERSKGYPIRIIITSKDNQLKDIYDKSKIFMQAKGFKIDENKYPALLEHFGMTPVEAMAHGCVPIVLNKGGYRESVEDGKSGFLFNNEEEAVERLRYLIENEKELRIMSENSKKRAKKFSLERLHKDLDRMILSINQS